MSGTRVANSVLVSTLASIVATSTVRVNECCLWFQVQLKEGQSEEEGTAIADDLMEKLSVHKDSLVTGAYMDQILKLQKLAAAKGDAEDKPEVTAPAVEVGN